MKKDGASATHNHRDQEHVGSVHVGRTRPRTLWRRYGGGLVLVLALAVLGCGGGDDDLGGTWTGTVQDNLAGTGTALFTFSQGDSRLTGNWQFTFPDPRNNSGGTLSGTVSDDSISLSLVSAQPQACSFTVAAERDDDDRFTGTYTAFTCALQENGGLDVHRQ